MREHQGIKTAGDWYWRLWEDQLVILKIKFLKEVRPVCSVQIVLHNNKLVDEGKFFMEEFQLIMNCIEFENHHFVTLNEMMYLGSDHQWVLKSAGRLVDLYNGWIRLAEPEPTHHAGDHWKLGNLILCLYVGCIGKKTAPPRTYSCQSNCAWTWQPFIRNGPNKMTQEGNSQPNLECRINNPVLSF